MPTNIFNIISQLNKNLPNLNNLNTPDEVAQCLLNSGIVNQDQVNQTKQLWRNPQIQQMIKQRYPY